MRSPRLRKRVIWVLTLGLGAPGLLLLAGSLWRVSDTRAMVVGTAGLLLIALAYYLMRTEIVNRTHARNEVVAANAELQKTIAEMERRSLDIELLSEMSELLQLSASVAESSSIVQTFGARLFAASEGAVYLTGRQHGFMELSAFWGEAPDAARFPMSDCWGLRRAHAHVTRPGEALICAHHDTSALTICIPMLSLGEVVGLLTLASDRPMAHNAELFAKTFADQVALAVANLRMQETLRTRAVRDGLTGLYNRTAAEEHCDRELARATAERYRVGLMLIDVDHFKRYNDRWGHAGGDAVLRQIARLLESTAREADIVCRYGGDEFAVILPKVTDDELRHRAASVVAQARALEVHVDEQPVGAVTLSVGIAETAPGGATTQALLKTADRALYAAKAGGRDRLATPPPHAVGLDAA